MANICSNSLVVSGPEAVLKKLRKGIAAQDPAVIKAFDYFEPTTKPGIYYGLEDDLEEIRKGKGPICCFITSKWGPPIEQLETFTAAYPTLEIEDTYEEPGNNVYGKVTCREGACTVRNQDAEKYLLENNEDFCEWVFDIKEIPYEEFLKKYVIDYDELVDDAEDPTFNQYQNILEKFILKRMKYEDLPLFINHSWWQQENAKEYKRRIAGEGLRRKRQVVRNNHKEAPHGLSVNA